MDGCYKCCEINTVSLTYRSLQVLPWNNDITIEKMVGCNRCRQITDFLQHIHFWNQRGKNSCWKNAWLQLFFYNTKRNTHRMGGCNWNCELTQYLSNTCQIHCKYAIHGCKCSSKKYCIHWGMNGSSYFHGIMKHCTLKKKLFPATNRRNLQGKMVFLDQVHSLLLSAAILLRFLYICQ